MQAPPPKVSMPEMHVYWAPSKGKGWVGGGPCTTSLNQAVVREQGLGQCSAALWAEVMWDLQREVPMSACPKHPGLQASPRPPARPFRYRV